MQAGERAERAKVGRGHRLAARSRAAMAASRPASGAANGWHRLCAKHPLSAHSYGGAQPAQPDSASDPSRSKSAPNRLRPSRLRATESSEDEERPVSAARPPQSIRQVEAAQQQFKTGTDKDAAHAAMTPRFVATHVRQSGRGMGAESATRRVRLCRYQEPYLLARVRCLS